MGVNRFKSLREIWKTTSIQAFDTIQIQSNRAKWVSWYLHSVQLSPLSTEQKVSIMDGVSNVPSEHMSYFSFTFLFPFFSTRAMRIKWHSQQKQKASLWVVANNFLLFLFPFLDREITKAKFLIKSHRLSLLQNTNFSGGLLRLKFLFLHFNAEFGGILPCLLLRTENKNII